MYCVQWTFPVLLITKHVNPILMRTYIIFIVLYLIGCLLEQKPYTVCFLAFWLLSFSLLSVVKERRGTVCSEDYNCDTITCDYGWIHDHGIRFHRLIVIDFWYYNDNMLLQWEDWVVHGVVSSFILAQCRPPLFHCKYINNDNL